MARLPLLAGMLVVFMLTLAMPAADEARAIEPGGYSPALVVPTRVIRRKACGADYSVPCKRGIAIMSPIESPDRCRIVVGGKPACVPYYPDYCRHLRQGPRVCVPGNGAGDCAPPGIVETVETIEVVETEGQHPAHDSSAYGFYSGADQNETVLTRLGGLSNNSAEPAAPVRADLLDMIESGQ